MASTAAAGLAALRADLAADLPADLPAFGDDFADLAVFAAGAALGLVSAHAGGSPALESQAARAMLVKTMGARRKT